MRDIPQIRIKDAWLLREAASVPMNELRGNGESLRSDKEYAGIVDSYQKAWKPYEKKILEGLCRITGLQFRQNIIDVYIAPWFAAFSDPMVIGTRNTPDRFIDILTHELIHRLLTDNTTLPFDTELVPKWEEMYGRKHSFNTLIHIPVHVVHKAVYLDVLESSKRLKRDENHKIINDYKDYMLSWEYVENRDYKALLKELQESYADLQKDNS